jgi:hypothetical protein
MKLTWQARLLKVEQAMAVNNVASAELLWRNAHAAAVQSRQWEGMVAVADTYRALGAQADFPAASIAKSRQTYLRALFRARREGSLAGVLIVADRFAELGDREAIERCMRVARRVAAQSRDPYAEEHLRAFADRLADGVRLTVTT